jgi:hypothetical protein
VTQGGVVASSILTSQHPQQLRYVCTTPRCSPCMAAGPPHAGAC